jgi:hypothetical protein
MILSLLALVAHVRAEDATASSASGELPTAAPSATTASPASGAGGPPPATPPDPPAPTDPRDAAFDVPSDPRDAAFGADDPRDEAFGAASDTASRDDALLGADTASPEGALRDTLAELDERVTIGGRLYLRANANLTEDTAAADTAFSTPNFLDLYVDARPNDRIRGYVQARTYHDLSVTDGDVNAFTGQPAERTRVLLDQLWLNFDVGHRVFVTAGRQRVKWGIGRFWNPTDFLQPARLDALAFFDERTGVGLLKAHVPLEKTGTNIYAFAMLEGASRLEEIGGAVRVEQVVGLTEVAISASGGPDRPTLLGGQFSTGIAFFDLKAEAALTRGLTMPFYRGSFDWGPLDERGAASILTLEQPEQYSREDEWVPQVVVGLEIPVRFGDDDALYLGAEYFWNDAGYEDASLYPWLLFNGAFQPFYVGHDYVSVYASAPGLGRTNDHTVTVSTLGNLSDRSFISRVDYAVRALTFLNVNAFVAGHYGELGELRLGLEVPPITGLTETRTTIAAPTVDLGIGAQILF